MVSNTIRIGVHGRYTWQKHDSQMEGALHESIQGMLCAPRTMEGSMVEPFMLNPYGSLLKVQGHL